LRAVLALTGSLAGLSIVGAVFAVVATGASAGPVGAGNGLIAFMSARSGSTAVWEMHSNGTGQTRLTFTHDSAWDGFPAYSPDGRRIAYVCGNMEICVMNADGSGQVRLTQNDWPAHRVYDGVPSWSPDGTKIAFDQYLNRGDDLYVVNVDGTGLHQLTSGSYDENAAWSPDGSQITFDGFDSATKTEQIFVVNADGTNRRRLTSTRNLWNVRPEWSPDGSSIAYVQQQAFGRYHIHVMHADGTGDHALTSGNWSQYAPRWSRDGTLIAYDSNQGGAENVWVMNSAGGGQKQLTHGGGFNVTPTWQPVPSVAPTAPLPATSTVAPSQPTPEARLGGISFELDYLITQDIADLQERNAIGVVAGIQLIADAARLRKETLPIVPATPGGAIFKRDMLRVYTDAFVTGVTYTKALRDAVLGKLVALRREAKAYEKDLARLLVAQGDAFAAS
jgi:Tol biopolymer transport system component